MNTFGKVLVALSIVFGIVSCNGFDLNNSDCNLTRIEPVSLDMNVSVVLAAETNIQPDQKITVTLMQQCCGGKEVSPVVYEGKVTRASESDNSLYKVNNLFALENSNDELVISVKLYNTEGTEYIESIRYYSYLEATNSNFSQGKYIKHCSFDESDFALN